MPHSRQKATLGQDPVRLPGTPLLELSVVLPCRNEAATVARCVQQAIVGIAALAVAGEVIVVDDASDDGSAALAQAAGARIVTSMGRGYGAAIRTGIETARGRYVVVADADGTYVLDDISGFWQKLSDGADLVIGNRFNGEMPGGSMPFWHRHLGNPLLSAIGRLAFDAPVTDFHCGIRAFNRDAIVALRLTSEGMEFATEMIAKAAVNLLTITEVPTTLGPASPGRRSHLRPVRDAARHVALIAVLRIRR